MTKPNDNTCFCLLGDEANSFPQTHFSDIFRQARQDGIPASHRWRPDPSSDIGGKSG